MHRSTRIGLAAMLVFICALAWGGEFTISAQPSGTANNQTLRVTISPAVEDVGKAGAIYIAALLPNGQWFFLTSSGWRQWVGGNYPAFSSGALAITTATPLDRMDVSALRGAAIYAGYGTSPAAMLTNGTYALVFVVGGATPTISGTASCGTWNAPSVTAYGLNADGSRASVLGTTSADSQGNYALNLGAYPTGAVEIVAAGGTYRSLHDGASRSRDISLSALLPGVSVSVTGVGITPVTELVAKRARELLLSGAVTVTQAYSSAAYAIETIFGLRASASASIPRFDAAAIVEAPAAAQIALLIGALENLGARFYAEDPQSAVAALALDFADGVFDGTKSGLAITVGGVAIATDLGTSKLLTSVVRYASAYTSGLLPAYAAAVTPTYSSRTIPVYVAQTVPAYRAGVVAAYTANPTPITPNTRGTSSMGQYSCTDGATISYRNGRHSCSDGSIPVFTAQSIEPYRAGMVLPFEAAAVGQDIPAGTVPVYTSVTDIHVYTDAERAAMSANSSSYPSGGSLDQPPLTQAQIDAYAVLNNNIQVWYSGNPFR
jgi:hypothetical protein